MALCKIDMHDEYPFHEAYVKDELYLFFAGCMRESNFICQVKVLELKLLGRCAIPG